jgi:hypothetical protein
MATVPVGFAELAPPVIRPVIKVSDLRLLLVSISLMLAGCSSDWMHARELSEQQNSVVPTDYKADIVAFMRTYLNDPQRVRAAFASEPQKRTIDNVDRYVVCLRYNARNSSGRYAGSKDSLVLFRSGRLDLIVDNARERCKDAAYKPFPELERMSR